MTDFFRGLGEQTSWREGISDCLDFGGQVKENNLQWLEFFRGLGEEISITLCWVQGHTQQRKEDKEDM